MPRQPSPPGFLYARLCGIGTDGGIATGHEEVILINLSAIDFMRTIKLEGTVRLRTGEEESEGEIDPESARRPNSDKGVMLHVGQSMLWVEELAEYVDESGGLVHPMSARQHFGLVHR